VKNVVQDLTSAGIDWQREKWQSGLGSKFMYVFAPAGSEAFHNNLLKYAVEFIGSQQKGFGSSWAKGKRYLKKEVLCSGTALKRACVIKNKYVNHDFEEYGTEVYYYQTEDCARIVKTILDYIVDHLVDMERLFNLLSVMNEQQIRLDTAVHGINSNGIERQRELNKGYLQELKAFLTDLNTLNRKNSHSDFIWKLR